MKTSVTSYGYKIKKKDLSSEQISKVKKDMLIVPFVYDPVKNRQNTDKKFNILSESPSSLYVPRFYGIDNFGPPLLNKLPDGVSSPNLEFKGELREIQKPIAEAYLSVAKDRGGGLISLKCGGGKTVLALNIACHIKKKTIVICHKSFLLTQWAERIQQFIPNAKIGYIQGKTIDTEGKDIVLGMLQSISMKEYANNLFEQFGLAIFDEAHHLSAEVFSRAMKVISPKYTLGLSATIKRADNTHHVFQWYLGNIVYESPEEINNHRVETRLIHYISEDPKYCKIQTIYNGTICRPKMVNQICEYKPRTDLILNYLYKYYDEGRTVLILSERRQHLIDMMDLINEHYKEEVAGLYIGGIHPELLEQTSKLRCILGSYQMFSEGADIPSLDTVILASPVSSVEQSVGRIFRKYGEYHKLILDIIDENIPCFEKQSKKRVKLYKSKKYELYDDDSEEKIDYKTRAKKKKKEVPIHKQECLF
uniref:Helicase ATP-binding domain-containing protein n=1 Tax=viral metagenome TaxID=1070528 RepID=A0A6C0C5S8_9ZZZZ